jgi:hypothetical protein
VPVAAVMLGIFRMITHGYGHKPDEDKPRKPAEGGEPAHAGDEPVRAEATAGEPFQQRRAADGS